MEESRFDKRMSNHAIRRRHQDIIDEYDRLVLLEKEANSLRAEYIPKKYYIKLIATNPKLGMSENYISKIINARYR